jgi:hypothetical protein
MNLKEYQTNVELMEIRIIHGLPFWQVRRFLPSLHLSGKQLYLSSEDSADGMDAKELLEFIRCMVQFGGYSKEEVFNESTDDLGSSEEGDEDRQECASGQLAQLPHSVSELPGESHESIPTNFLYWANE